MEAIISKYVCGLEEGVLLINWAKITTDNMATYTAWRSKDG